MKKLNFNNRTTDDDKEMIIYLTSSLKKEPSPNFTNNTLSELSKLNYKPKQGYKPLKTPLIMMGIIGLLLLAPLLNISSEGTSLNTVFFDLQVQLIAYLQSSSTWYLASLISVFLVIQILITLELRISNNRNTLV